MLQLINIDVEGVETIAFTMSTSPSQVTVQPGLVERTTTLAAITVVGFIGNLVVVVTICQSSSLRATHFNKHLVNMAIINLTTCILAMPMVIGYTVTSEWDFGELMCKILAHFIISNSIATCLNIFMLNIDRVIAISNPDRYPRRINTFRTVLMILAVWAAAILFPLPLTLGTVATNPFEDRYICSIGVGSDINYLIALYSVCFAVPAIINVLLFIYISLEALSEKEAESNGVTRRSSSAVRLWPEVQSAGVVFIIYLLWILFELPYITLSSVEQYIHSGQVQGEFVYSADLDTAFVWLKFCDCCLLPFIIFKWRKDIWLKFKDLMFCRKSNSVLDSSPRMKQRKHNTKPKLRQHQTAVKADTPKFEASFPIPTLKATKDGLHVQGNVEDEEEDRNVFYATMDVTGRTNEFDSLRATTQATIEYYGEPEIRQDEHVEDTSDYETDPYSHSDPISVKSASGSQSQKASSVTGSDSKEFRTKANSVSHDSGHGSAGSSAKKKRRKPRAVADLCIEDGAPVPDIDLMGLPASLRSECETDTAPPTDKPHKSTKHKSKPKRSQVTDESAVPSDDFIQSLEETNTSKPHKKKNKKKRQNVSDAETNTSQVINMERVMPRPPRLEPLKADVLPPLRATPPLRNRMFKEEAFPDSLPPSGGSVERRRKYRTSNTNGTTDEERSKKKRSSRQRTTSGDSQKGLMSSNTSSEMNSAVGALDQVLQESQL